MFQPHTRLQSDLLLPQSLILFDGPLHQVLAVLVQPHFPWEHLDTGPFPGDIFLMLIGLVGP
jgi:hypothetical protein